jgi:glucokinase
VTILAADIGATHARFALAEPDAHQIAPEMMMVAGIATLEEALSRFLKSKGVAANEIDAAIIAAAGPIRGDGSIKMTNCPWIVDPKAIGAAHDFGNVCILNDMTAAALGLLRLAPEDTEILGGKDAVPKAPMAILAPGTGLGVSGLIPCAGGGWTALSGEGGHVDLAPSNDREIAIVFHLIRSFGHASPERILSGPGLETLYETLTALDGTGTPPLAAVDIAGAARREEAQAAEAIKLFCGWLGAVAGDLALTLGARGGVYIAGGILPHWGDLFDRALFRRRFNAKGRFGELLDPIPTYLVGRNDLALMGCLEEARRLLG